jgi:hypothetical protein
MTTSYSILTTVSLRHDYYADGRCPDFQIRPAAQTLAWMRGLFILSRMIGDTLVLLVKVDETGKTCQSLPQDLKLSFYLELINTDFLNFSNAPAANGMVSYGSNIFHNEAAGALCLNSPVPGFSAAEAYIIGDMVADGGDIFEAIRPVSPGSHATSDADFWQRRLSHQYVHNGDLIRLSDGNLHLDVTAAGSFVVEVFSLNLQTRVFDVPVESRTLSFSANVTELSLDLQHLPPAKYRIAINGVDHFVYADRTASYARVYGILELYNCFPAADDFGWLNAGGIPKALDHVLRFANRLAIWKYITRTTNVTAVENTDVPNAFEAGDEPKQFVSRKPLFMQQQPVKTLRVLSGATVLASRLANPPPDRIATCIEDGNEYFCAEMYLNY